MLKRIWVLLLCGIVIGGAADWALNFRFFDRPLTQTKQEEFQSQIHLPRNFTLAASVNSFDTVKNSLGAAEQNVRNGSFALELNVTASTAGNLFLADGPEYLTPSSVKLESVFDRFSERDYMRYILNIRNAVPPEKLMALAEKYSLFGRIMLILPAFEDPDEDLMPYSAFLTCVPLDMTAFDASDPDTYIDQLTAISDYGMSAICFPIDQATDALCAAFNALSQLRLVITDVNSTYTMYQALSYNPNIVITERPENLYELMLSQDYLDLNLSGAF